MAKSEKPADKSKSERRKEIEDEIKLRLDDPRQLLDRYIEAEVERRIWTFVKVAGWISSAVIAVVIAVLSMGGGMFKEYVGRKVQEATAPAVIQQITNSLASIEDQAGARAREIESIYLNAVSNHNSLTLLGNSYMTGFSNRLEEFSSDVSHYHSQVITNGEKFLERLAVLRATDNVYTITDLVSLVHVQLVTNYTQSDRTMPSNQIRMLAVPLDFEPLGGHVEVRIVSERIQRNFQPKPLTAYGFVEGKNAFIKSFPLGTHIGNTNNRVTFEYLIKPHFKPTP